MGSARAGPRRPRPRWCAASPRAAPAWSRCTASRRRAASVSSGSTRRLEVFLVLGCAHEGLELLRVRHGDDDQPARPVRVLVDLLRPLGEALVHLLGWAGL